ncbi:MAG TPA: YdcF family protein [Thermohalobaculum sp.]|nr:YdcF family protein [Thermohalobaculum sp.]
MRSTCRWLLGLLLLGVTVWALTAGAVLWAAERTLDAHLAGRSIGAPVDAIVVLGAGIDRKGNLGKASSGRVAAAVEVWEAGKAGALIVSGGPAARIGTPVAVLMRAHAVRLGVPPERVLLEDRADSTFENLRFSFGIARRHGMERLALASDAYHLPRARALAAFLGERRVGLVAARGPSPDASWEAARPLLREALAWWHNLGKAAAWTGLDALGWQPAGGEALVG